MLSTRNFAVGFLYLFCRGGLCEAKRRVGVQSHRALHIGHESNLSQTRGIATRGSVFQFLRNASGISAKMHSN